MAKAPKTSTPAYEVRSGALHRDNWIGAQVALTVEPQAEPRTIRVTVWNPAYNREYLNNPVTVKLDGRTVFSEKMHPARAASIDYVLAPDEPLDVEVESGAVMMPDALDPRERGVILKLAQEPVKG